MDRLMICDKLLRLNLSAFHLHGTCFAWALTKDKDIESLGLRWIEMRTGNGDT